MTLSFAAFALVGIVAALIFLFDGWRSPKDPDTPLHKSPKLRGFLYLATGFGISISHSLLGSNQGNEPLVFLCSCAATIIVGLFIIYVQSCFVAYGKVRDILPYAPVYRFVGESLNLAMVAAQDGVRDFRFQADQRSIDLIIEERNRYVAFLVGMVNAAIEREQRKERGADAFAQFAQSFLFGFVTTILERSSFPRRFRACIVYLNAPSNQIFHYVGVHPTTDPYRIAEPLSAETSLAAYALDHPMALHRWYAGEGAGRPQEGEVSDSVPWEDRKHPYRYKSVICCGIQPPQLSYNASPKRSGACIMH